MKLTVQKVEPQFIAKTWPMVEAFITRGLEHTDDYTADQVKVLLSTGSWLLIVMVDEYNQVHGAGTVAFSNDVNDRTAIITSLGGRAIVTDEIFEQFCRIVRMLGATRVQTYARDSAARLYERVGLAKKATLMEIKL